MVVKEVEQIDLGANVPVRVKVAEKECSTNRRDFGVNVPGWEVVEEVAQTVFGVNVPGRVMVVEEVARTVFGVNVPGRVMVVEEVAQTVFGVNVPGRVMVVEEVAQTVFGVSVFMAVEEVAQTVFGVNVPGRVMVVEEVAQTVIGVNVPGRVMAVEEVAQTPFGVNVFIVKVPNLKIYTDVVTTLYKAMTNEINKPKLRKKHATEYGKRYWSMCRLSLVSRNLSKEGNSKRVKSKFPPPPPPPFLKQILYDVVRNNIKLQIYQLLPHNKLRNIPLHLYHEG